MKRHDAMYGFVWQPETTARPSILNATYRVQSRRWIDPRIVNHHWVLDYSISDYGLYRVGREWGKWHERHAQVAHLYPPNTPYGEDLRRARMPIRDSYIVFSGGESAGLESLIAKGTDYARFVDSEYRIGKLIQEAAWIGHAEGRLGYWKAQSKLCELIHLLLHSRHVRDETYRISGTVRPSAYSPLTTAVREFFQAHLTVPLHLRELADRLHISLSTLCHRYREETGESPMYTRLRMRVEMAKNLLIKGQGLKGIAEATGFCDPYHLSRTFKRVTGLSPRQYVKSTGSIRKHSQS